MNSPLPWTGYLIRVFFFFLLILSPWSSFAREGMPLSYVVDDAGIIADEAEQLLLVRLQELEQKTGTQMLILTLETTGGVPIEEFALKKAEEWKLGQKGKDNGLLFVVALKDRKYRIEAGYGIESIIPDSLAGTIARQNLVPYFKRGLYTEGIHQTALILMDTIAASQGVTLDSKPYPASQKRQKSSGNALKNLLSLFFFFLVFGLGLFQRRSSGNSWNRTSRRYSGMGFPLGGTGRIGGFGGGGFGSFGGGGGGGFGGGGVSGGW